MVRIPATYLGIAQALDHVLQYSSYLLLPASLKRFNRPTIARGQANIIWEQYSPNWGSC
ncbi:uncharacterized protein P174DRAFT_443271 [Aspergillus novofumigatus IBT 16806]|uniref:Uncharacterized protein n=1 Tax=Aspergillus novofumigatus (strain IBT 16806) TaxID=1392255 RepID=A0A2I1C6Z3_ASPN1|nr:uncharacterized protein P174DRAFT_443271 [Aspergillus novofumigatus IBT 16806]PKX93397.1 hypothetical protein P174DRAFT_443271 [Aspergillus novofumigatus IBT 16806]